MLQRVPGITTNDLFMSEDWIAPGSPAKVSLYRFYGEIAKPYAVFRLDTVEDELELWIDTDGDGDGDVTQETTDAVARFLGAARR
jgi:hypothetical protein